MTRFTVMGNHVFIPSRGRWEEAAKLVESWRSLNFHVHFIVEPDEQDTYLRYMFRSRPGAQNQNPTISIHPLPIRNGGIGHSRMHCINLAGSWGMKSIVLADDDIKPNVKYNSMSNFAACATHHKVLGITARYGYHDLCLGRLIRGRDDLILLPTGTFRLVALNVDNVLEIGNYDKHLEYAEDNDLFLRGLQAGYPWMIHLGTRSNSVGTRYQPGGMLDYAGGEGNLKAKKKLWHEQLYAKYPNIVNNPDKADFDKQNSIRVSWQKAYDTYLPGWKKWSMLHGGELSHYLGMTHER